MMSKGFHKQPKKRLSFIFRDPDEIPHRKGTTVILRHIGVNSIIVDSESKDSRIDVVIRPSCSEWREDDSVHRQSRPTDKGLARGLCSAKGISLVLK
jgi:hypothetical protein